MEKENQEKSKIRYGYLDTLRGITLLSMMAYHAVWDLVYLAGFDWKWFQSDAGLVWQQSICWTFILLSGFCWSLGRRRLYRGALVFGGGLLISAVTWIFTYEERITFGVLTLLGTAMLLMIALEKVFRRIPPVLGCVSAMLAFLFTKGINDGFLGFYYFGKDGIEALELFRLPGWLYQQGYFFTFIGFTDNRFYSADYFSIFPWIFLFIAGYFLYRAALGRNILSRIASHVPRLPFEGLGRHSLLIYLLHQPVVYLALILLGVVSI